MVVYGCGTVPMKNFSVLFLIEGGVVIDTGIEEMQRRHFSWFGGQEPWIGFVGGHAVRLLAIASAGSTMDVVCFARGFRTAISGKLS